MSTSFGSIQTEYPVSISGYKVGTVQSVDGFITTRVAEGAISFGHAVKRGTDTGVQAEVGGGANFIGIAVRTIGREGAYADASIGIKDGETFNVVRGQAIVYASPANAVSAGDPLVVVDATGALRGGSAGAGQTLIEGAYWEEDIDANDVGLLMLMNPIAVSGTVTHISATATNTNKSFTKDAAAQAFSPLVAADGTTPYVYFISSGVLPAGMTINPATGSISGTPTATQTASSVSVGVKDANDKLASTFATFTITVTA